MALVLGAVGGRELSHGNLLSHTTLSRAWPTCSTGCGAGLASLAPHDTKKPTHAMTGVVGFTSCSPHSNGGRATTASHRGRRAQVTCHLWNVDPSIEVRIEASTG